MARKEASEAKARWARAHAGEPRTPIINHHSSIINARAFTLIELLVVISVIVLLMAILLPTLGRVKRQAKAVVCQSRLRQWGLTFAAYATEHDGKMPSTPELLHYWWLTFKCSGDSNDVLLCPMAARYRPAESASPPDGTFLAWGCYAGGKGLYHGSYGLNNMLIEKYFRQWDSNGPDLPDWAHERSLVNMPILLDCADTAGFVTPYLDPPEYERDNHNVEMKCFCINRHDGGVNGLFRDWSVRKVGLKELWTLKWYPACETAGPWTRAGGVRPEDWPQWMRSFKDY